MNSVKDFFNYMIWGTPERPINEVVAELAAERNQFITTQKMIPFVEQKILPYAQKLFDTYAKKQDVPEAALPFFAYRLVYLLSIDQQAQITAETSQIANETIRSFYALTTEHESVEAAKLLKEAFTSRCPTLFTQRPLRDANDTQLPALDIERPENEPLTLVNSPDNRHDEQANDTQFLALDIERLEKEALTLVRSLCDRYDEHANAFFTQLHTYFSNKSTQLAKKHTPSPFSTSDWELFAVELNKRADWTLDSIKTLYKIFAQNNYFYRGELTFLTAQQLLLTQALESSQKLAPAQGPVTLPAPAAAPLPENLQNALEMVIAGTIQTDDLLEQGFNPQQIQQIKQAIDAHHRALGQQTQNNAVLRRNQDAEYNRAFQMDDIRDFQKTIAVAKEQAPSGFPIPIPIILMDLLAQANLKTQLDPFKNEKSHLIEIVKEQWEKACREANCVTPLNADNFFKSLLDSSNRQQLETRFAQFIDSPQAELNGLAARSNVFYEHFAVLILRGTDLTIAYNRAFAIERNSTRFKSTN